MVEVIGFIIGLLALLYIFMKQTASPARRQEQVSNDEEEEESEDPFRDFLKAVEKESAAREVAQRMPPPPPPVKKTKQAKKTFPPSSSKESRLTSSIERSKPILVDTEEKEYKPSRAQLAIQRLANRQDMIIYQEIIDKPKSLRS